ncbi:hypothetical protein OUZ56_032828 [Daphnia magna]|uniref:Ankyrin repeat domain-containing protein n=1 Tax=Daphnia magna TaxID=35525 RepID=A0ABR0B9N8_9CRUS|nr:hypothetical protein OUZ56_032828 [Daphnia magna]
MEEDIRRPSNSDSDCEFMQKKSFLPSTETEEEENSTSKVGHYYSKLERDLDPSSSDSEMAVNCKAVSVISNKEEQESWSLPVPLITQTAYCKNCMMKAFPAMDTEMTRRRIIAITMLMKGEFNYNMLEVPRETIRKHLLEARKNGKNIKQILDTVFSNGTSLLHGNVIKERFDVTDMFLQYGADSNIYEEGMIIAHLAAADNNVHLLRILSHHGNIFNIQNSMGEPPLLVAIALNNMEFVKYLWMDRIIVHQTLDEETVLHYAAKYNNKFVAKPRNLYTIMEIIDDTEQTAQQEIPEAASLTLEQIPEIPIKGETESGLPEIIDEFNDKIKFEISKMHEQYKINLITEFEDLHLNDFDYNLKSHPAHETMEMEQLNILND